MKVRRGLKDPQLQVHPEKGALVHLAEHLDGAAHQFHNALGDGHTQAGALDLVGGAVLRPGKGVEDGLQVFRRHAVAVVLHLDADVLVLAGALFQPDEPQPDMAALRRVLHRVGQQIDQDLVDPGFVPHQILMADACHLQVELLLFRLGHGLDDGVRRGNHIAQGELLQIERYFSALNFRDIQNVVDQAEQVLSGGCDFPGIFSYLGRILRVPGQQRGKAQHRVHRCADVVGHVGQERGFGLTGNLGGPQRRRQLLTVDLPLRLPLPAQLVLLPPVDVVEENAQEEGHQHGEHNNGDVLVDGPALLLDGLHRLIAHQVDGPVVHRPHIIEGVNPPDIVIEQDVPPCAQGVGHFRLDLRVLDAVGPVKVRQIQVARGALAHPLGLEDKPLAGRVHNIQQRLPVIKFLRKGPVYGVVDIFGV